MAFPRGGSSSEIALDKLIVSMTTFIKSKEPIIGLSWYPNIRSFECTYLSLRLTAQGDLRLNYGDLHETYYQNTCLFACNCIPRQSKQLITILVARLYGKQRLLPTAWQNVSIMQYHFNDTKMNALQVSVSNQYYTLRSSGACLLSSIMWCQISIS